MDTSNAPGLESASFVRRHQLWTDQQAKAARDVAKTLAGREVELVRFSFADQHGVLRGKTLAAAEALARLESGVGLTTTLLAKDTSHKTVFPVFTAGGGFDMPAMQGAADFLAVPDPTTFRILPWAPGTAWMLCDAYFADGSPVPFDSRRQLRLALASLKEAGFVFKAGLEVEFHLFKVTDQKLSPLDSGQPGTPPEVGLLTSGYQYLTEQRYDQIDTAVQLLRQNLEPLGLPLRSFEVEFGPSQVEITMGAMEGALSADAMILFRSAVKQIARRNGYHASFMCRPRLPNVMSSGWHLHQSLVDEASRTNAFTASDAQLSQVGQHYLAGLLEHAKGATALATPTINGYKRYRPLSLAPDRILWGSDNRGAMLRVIGQPNDPNTRIENRIGEPAANPYLYFASQIYAGLDGIARKLLPPPSADTPYEAKAEFLPRTLSEALMHLRHDEVLCRGFGAPFVDYYCRLKEAEVARFNLEVSEWEHREYFELF